MTILYTILSAGQTAGNGEAGQSSLGFWIMIALLFLIMWLFMIRPQRKQQKELENFRNQLQKGDKVITAGGIYGVIAEIQEKTVLLKVDGEVKLRVDKSSIVRDTTDVQAAQQK